MPENVGNKAIESRHSYRSHAGTVTVTVTCTCTPHLHRSPVAGDGHGRGGPGGRGAGGSAGRGERTNRPAYTVFTIDEGSNRTKRRQNVRSGRPGFSPSYFPTSSLSASFRSIPASTIFFCVAGMSYACR